MDIEKLRFPIGEFIKPEIISVKNIDEWITEIELFPKRISELVSELSETQLMWHYKPSGWTIKQIVHHCADSHMNSFIRFKLSLTENNPTIKPYFEDKWADLPDTLNSSISTSLQILNGLHSRWVILLRSLNQNELEKEFTHPEHGKQFTISENIGIYAWHCNHHLAHIKKALEFRGNI